MAIIAPFAALRYDERKAGRLEALLTQPYDKITPEMQREYFARSPFNLAHLVKGEVSGSITGVGIQLSATAYSIAVLIENG